MKHMAALSREEREELFLNTAHKVGMPPAIVEKDFWVCYMLDYLFHRCAWKERLVFKGGTSLSKAYHLIERFSEDIDLILDWRLLGYGIEEPCSDYTICCRTISTDLYTSGYRNPYSCS